MEWSTGAVSVELHEDWDVIVFKWYSLNFKTLIDTKGSYTDWNSLVLRILKFEKQLDYSNRLCS